MYVYVNLIFRCPLSLSISDARSVCKRVHCSVQRADAHFPLLMGYRTCFCQRKKSNHPLSPPFSLCSFIR